MANYLERVASSAGRRAAIAKPPTSGPPVLPAGRDFSIAPSDPFASDEEQFLETLETSETGAPAQTEERAEASSAAKPKVEKITGDEALATPVHTEPKPHTTVERLSTESPFPVHVPRTLRPSVAAEVPPVAAGQPPRERPRVRASTTVGPEEFTIGEGPAPLIRSVDSDVNKTTEPVTAEADTPAQPVPLVATPVDEYQTPVPVRTEATVSDTTPIPRVDRVNGPARDSAEPSPPPASPVHLPPVINTTARQEQSRISIGSLEVLVNNHPRVTTVRPGTKPSRSEGLNLEKRYLDRFRLRH